MQSTTLCREPIIAACVGAGQTKRLRSPTGARGVTRTERTPRLLASRGKEMGIDAADVEKGDFAPDSPRGNAIGRMVDASEIGYVTAFLASDKAWAISGELIVATGGAGRSVYY